MRNTDQERKHSQRFRDKNPGYYSASSHPNWPSRDPEYMRVKRLEWNRRNREKRRAQIAVQFALQTGKLVRLPCEVCANPESHAHHEDYANRLDVKWLCATHHKLLHRKQ